MKKITYVLFLALGLMAATLGQAQPTIDGDLSDAQYTTLATKLNSNAGFGPDVDVSEIRFFSDAANQILYLGAIGKFDLGNNNGLGLWLNLSGQTGKAAGTSLGISQAGDFHHINAGGGSDLNYAADFEVDLMLTVRPANGTDVDGFFGDHIGNTSAGFIAQTDLVGTSASVSGYDFDNDGNAGSITFAFNNGTGPDQGWELAIEYDAIGATPSQSLQVFGMVVSNTAFFSDVTVPGNVTTGNPGFNADFSTLTGGPYATTATPLPVVWLGFGGEVRPEGAWLQWQTAREWDNLGFAVERSHDGAAFKEITFMPAVQTGNEGATYEFLDPDFRGEAYYRLRQVDLDGQHTLSQVIKLSATSLRPRVRVYPQPLAGDFRWEVAAEPGTLLQVALLDLQGRRLLQRQGTAQELETQLAETLRGLSQGSYLLQTLIDGQRYSQRIQKQ